MIGTAAGIVVYVLGQLSMAQPPASAQAQAFDINERTQYYDVRGNTAHELVEQMRTLGPMSPSGRRSWAFTAWEVRANYDLAPGKDGGCAVTEPRAQLEIVTTLPRWEVTVGSLWRLRAQWEQMLPHLLRHEQTHRAHAQLAAQAAATGLGELPLQPDCPAADRAVQRVLRTAVAASRRLSLDYDRVTHFGASEGVQLERPESAAEHVVDGYPRSSYP